jgi:Tfp pilus assembly protein PilF
MIKGICEHEAGFRSQAIKSLEQAIQLEPEFKDARYWIAIVKSDTGFLRRIWNLFRRQ